MPEDVFALPVVRRLDADLTLRRLGALDVVVLDHPHVRAAIALQGAHLLAWQPQGAEPVLWLSETGAFEEGRAVRGGVPICWPWFGPAGRPNHGFARILPWTLLDCREDDDGVHVGLVLRDGEESRAYWPFAFEAVARFALGRRECRIELTARGDFESTAALHTYLRVGDLDGVRVTGLDGHYVDKVLDVEADADRDPATGRDGLSFPDRIDRIYTRPDEVSRLHDPAGKRVVEVHHAGHSDVVVWNPGAELTRTMADVPDDGYREFVCVETARISRPLVSDPQAPTHLTATLRIAADA
ncbi:D-hexose-6-phosphate mutarotase [Embleya sp. NPDC050493]|uniref:D-hexose-6-phosphate mutarotase n=1 Tax=Embleya sp. NPDC050493 TaxID=3363989 RepID=UPI00379BF90B